MPDHDMHKQYARCMRKRSEGHALYRNVSAAKLKPGACGYFDTQGDWQVIVQTTDAAALRDLGLPALKGVQTFADDGEDYWRGAVTSEGVEGHRVVLDAHGSEPTGTVAAGTRLEFSSSKTRSAILVADGIIEHNQGTPATKFRDWGGDNAQALIDVSGDRGVIKRKGFWIVTKTFTARRCSISFLRSKESKTSYSVDARSHGTNASPTAEWWSSQRDDNWRDLSHPEGVVMFMSGIWWRPRLLSSEMKAVLDAEKQEWLAGEEGPSPVDVSILSETSTSPQYYQFAPAVIRVDDQDALSLPKARRSPYDDNMSNDGTLQRDEEGEDEASEEEGDED